jgi:hypothetical protein
MPTEPPVQSRRFFVVTAEFPGLLFGVLRGEPVALRRIIGARGTGRWGIALSLVALVGAAPAQAFGALLGVHAALSVAGWLAVGARNALTLRQHQRLLLWACPLLLLGAALLRGLGSAWPALAAIALAHACVNAHVARARALGPDARD